MTTFPIKRDQLKPGEVLCSYCTALCCRYFSLPIEKPETWEEFDTVRWFMFHGNVTIYVDDDTWYICVYADCRHLQPDNSCGIYEDRPQICREYSTSDCEYDDDGVHDLLFETPEQLWDYAVKLLPPRDEGKNGRDKSGKRKKYKVGIARKTNGQAGSSSKLSLPVLQGTEARMCVSRQAGALAATPGKERRKGQRS